MTLLQILTAVGHTIYWVGLIFAVGLTLFFGGMIVYSLVTDALARRKKQPYNWAYDPEFEDHGRERIGYRGRRAA